MFGNPIENAGKSALFKKTRFKVLVILWNRVSYDMARNVYK